MTEARPTLRLDRWLWFARFYKTRTLATEMVQRGKVRVNSRIVKKPGTAVGPGDVLTLVQGDAVRVVKITGIPDRRGPASEAMENYHEAATSDGAQG